MRHDRQPRTPAGKQIGIRVPARMGEQLEAIAKRENNGVAAVIRRLLTKALAEQGADEAA